MEQRELGPEVGGVTGMDTTRHGLPEDRSGRDQLAQRIARTVLVGGEPGSGKGIPALLLTGDRALSGPADNELDDGQED